MSKFLNTAYGIFLSVIALSLFLFFNPTLVKSQLLKSSFEWSPPAGVRVNVPIVRDTFVSAVKGEQTGNNGAYKKLKLKGIQEYALVDIDTKDLEGYVISGAVLHFRVEKPEKFPLARLGVSSVATKWVEGNSKYYRPEKGSACFLQSELGNKNWAYEGSSIVDAVFGRGNTVWGFSNCKKPDSEGWQSSILNPDVISARVAGLSQGFCLSDELGNTWSIQNGNFEYQYFPDRYFYSRESHSGPWMEIWIGKRDSTAPEPIRSIEVDTNQIPPGEVIVSWETPEDNGPGKTLGFYVSYTDQGKEKNIPRYLIPMAGKTGEKVRMHIQDIPFEAGQLLEIVIRPVDSAGNIGLSFRKKIKLSNGVALPEISPVEMESFQTEDKLPEVNGLKVSVVDLLDKINPVNRKMIPRTKVGYKGGNHIFSGGKKKIRLHAARNEHVAFQLNLDGRSEDIIINYHFNEDHGLEPRIFQFASVKAGKTFYPDPLLPGAGSCSIPSKKGKVNLYKQSNQSFILELYIPHEESPGHKKGWVTIESGGILEKLEVDLTVWNFALPDKLSFIPEMNAYGTVNPYKGYEYYRLAHEHRACINRLPYGWDGQPEFAPEWDGKKLDWSEWDEKVGPLLDGTAFADLPRKNQPVDVFYLPVSENWPVNLFSNYKLSYWVDEAFSAEYKKELGSVFSSFATHLSNKKWASTSFQFYLNNKVYYRKRTPVSSAPWLFDEPINIQDFWALKWYGELFQEAVAQGGGGKNIQYRCDISFSQFKRDLLKGIMDIEYIGGNNSQKTRMKSDEQILWGRSFFSEYGSANAIDQSNVQPVLWCLSAWSKGASGVLPWQTIGKSDSWVRADTNALFYPHPEGPMPSVRLKAFTKGQQLVEYLSLLSDLYGLPRWTVAEWLTKQLNNDKADRISIDIERLWQLRLEIGFHIHNLFSQGYKTVNDKEAHSRKFKQMKQNSSYVPSPFKTFVFPDAKTFNPKK